MTRSIFESLAELEKHGGAAAPCTAIRERGSEMLVFPDGRIHGTVGGGEMESRVIREALAALKEGAAPAECIGPLSLAN